MTEPCGFPRDVSIAELALLRLLAFCADAPIDLALFDTPACATVFAEVLRDVAAERGQPAAEATVADALTGIGHRSWLSTDSRAVAPPPAVQERVRADIPPGERGRWIERVLRLIDAVLPPDADDPRTWDLYRRLEPHADAILAFAVKERIAHPTGIVMGEKLGVYQFLTGRVAEAEDLFRRALAIDEAHFGPAHPQTAADVTNLAVLLESTGRADQADALFARAVEILALRRAEYAGRFAIALGNLARAVARHGALAEAEGLARQAVSIDEKEYGADSHAVARDLRHVAEFVRDQERGAEAAELLQRALRADERAGGAEHPYVALDLKEIAAALKDPEPPASLIPLVARALAIDERWAPGNEAVISLDRLELASLEEQSGRPADAVGRYREVVRQQCAGIFVDPGAVALAAEKLTELAAADTDPAATLAALRDASAVMARELGPDDRHARVVRSAVVQALRRSGRRAEARAMDLDDRERQYRAGVDGNPERATAWSELALFLKNERGAFEEAERCYRRSLELAPDDATVLSNLALLLTSVRGKHDEAERLYRRAVALAPHDPAVLGNLASFAHNVRRQLDVADGLYRAALEIAPRDASILANQASLRVAQGRLDDAERLLAEAWGGQAARPDRFGARVLVLKAIVETLRGRDPATPLGQLRTLFALGIAHAPWPTAALADALREQMREEDRAFYSAILKAIDSRTGFEALQALDRWERQAAVRFDQPWDAITEI